MWTILKVCIEFVTIFLLLHSLLFGHEEISLWIFRRKYPRSAIEPALPARAGKVLTTGAPGKSRSVSSYPLHLLYTGCLGNSYPSLQRAGSSLLPENHPCLSVHN